MHNAKKGHQGFQKKDSKELLTNRISAYITEAELLKINKYIAKHGYKNASELIRQLINQLI